MSSIIEQATITPPPSMPILSRSELERLNASAHDTALQLLFRQCVLAVLNTGSASDDPAELFSQYSAFRVTLVPTSRGILLELKQAPARAFVDGQLIEGIREHLYAVLRDFIWMSTQLGEQDASSAVFQLLRNASLFRLDGEPGLAVCWGGHSISSAEYDYTKQVGYELGLRRLGVVTGCGPGAMKGPMKGANLGLAKQRRVPGRFIGITEPGIIAAEPPNPIVNELVVLPDIEKRLEAFVRVAHCLIIFPGGPGTAEELLYALALKMDPRNRDCQLPMILTASREQAGYFEAIDEFVRITLGEEAQSMYQIIIDAPADVARAAVAGYQAAAARRFERQEPMYYHSELVVDGELQRRFEPNHENMASLRLHRAQERFVLARELRKLFSGIVAGNIKQATVARIKQFGPFEITAEPGITAPLDRLLDSFVRQGRMKISGNYQPCYRVKPS
ncbi:MAG TPA: nucleotide 5'-monophosphate nucleosidase PpnN [Polyangiaceae bacterium]|nr:nucleotide 5'-monophosphate nucleosidase PpnN [Polyangiaceae bacterium]